MNKDLFYFLILTAIATTSCKQDTILPIETYKAEISSLKNEDEISMYWDKLYDLDQSMLKNSKSSREIDSTSITNMLRTALLYETHGNKIFSPRTHVPTLNLIHNYTAESNLAFWPIIRERVKAGGTIFEMGAGYPAYQLEGISFSFYDYSLFNQDSIHQSLVTKLNARTYETVSLSLIASFQELVDLRKLTTQKVLGKWRRQHFKNRDNERIDYFEFVKMSDHQIYLRRAGRLLKLNPIKNEKDYIIYRIENEPFGFHYKLKKNGELFLINDVGDFLITYSIQT
ncbi:hypothetical protein ADIWIN_1900 [Winogradskyella psychrotolerans RS-3]|uniref:Lipoprotein n=1 Tax=Winogradskyella psychrotolerans RS-3 TaxID=641526 RepID=S7X279_9FLAO|nr:hypothetical protein [Winogradskyella psychrotolerans]EPR73119.1 hypothetical protein ADIWIN_1900 [Winogradskyella psychrotolerans RS-3]